MRIPSAEWRDPETAATAARFYSRRRRKCFLKRIEKTLQPPGT
jgi:hypothetical protein